MVELTNTRWWKEPKDRAHDAIFDVVSSLKESYEARFAFWRLCYNMYSGLKGNTALHILEWSDEIRRFSELDGFNAAQSAVDTVYAMIGKSEPRVVYLTDGADRQIQKKAIEQANAVYGALESNNGYETLREIFLLSQIFQVSYGQVYGEQDPKNPEVYRLKLQKVFPWDIRVDTVDSYYGKPRSMFRIKYFDRDMAAAFFKQKSRIIEEAPSVDLMIDGDAARLGSTGQRIVDNITIIEAWHLPSRYGASDGLHVICTKNGELIREPWECEEFPFIVSYWNKPVVGYFGRSMIEEAGSPQKQADENTRSLQDTFGTQSKPIVLMHEEEYNEQKSALSADKVRCIRWKLHKPERMTDPIVSHQLLDREQTMINRVYEQVGINQLSAQSLKPTGLTSGKALMNYRDLTSERFALKMKAFDGLVVQFAKLAEQEARRIEGMGKKVVTEFVEGNQYSEYTWSDLLPEGTPYRVTIDVASSAEKQLYGRNQELENLYNAGAIPQEEFLANYKSPDIQAFLDKQNAPLDLIRMQLTHLKETGELMMPEKHQPNLELAYREAQIDYAKGLTNGAPFEYLKKLLDYMDAVSKLLDEKMQQAQAQAMAAAPPSAIPAQTPQPIMQ